MNAKILGVVVAVVVVIVLIANATFQVMPGNRALLLQFGRIVGDDYGPGLHFKIPFVQDVEIYDGRILTLDNQTQTMTTSDKQNLDVAYYTKWKIADPDLYYKAAGGQELVAMDRLSAILSRGLRSEFAKDTEDQLIAAAGHSVLKGLSPDTLTQVKALGVSLVDLRISSVHLPSQMLDGVYAQMRATREALAADERAKAEAAAATTRADADAKAGRVLAAAHLKAEEIRGAGDASAARVYAQAYRQNPDFFSFYRSLRSYREAVSKGGNVVVLGTDGPFFKYLHGPGAGK
ncbi:MAG TPA: protease modulator HflC [Nevskiaceae bacterium]